MEAVHDIDVALRRLDTLLPIRAPWLERTLLPPATDAEIEQLRAAITPRTLPDDLVSYLRWHNGQTDEETIEWWEPLNTGTLLPVKYMIRTYLEFRKSGFLGAWPPGWLPLAQEQLWATAIELTRDRPPVLIEITIDSRDVVAPSLAAMFHLTADLAERGILTSTEDGPSPGEETIAFNRAKNEAETKRYAQAWQHWPFRIKDIEDDRALFLAAGWADPE